jgi:hypothetical protein
MMETALALGECGGFELLLELVAIHRDTVREVDILQIIHAVAAFRAVCPQLQRTNGVEPNDTH